ncbi:LrgB family protein [Streptococcus tangpeifui]|uniref:LrgB family protein n=1 Tax=Streptococcus criceti HS-6 TaxID=873449 RepID=G5JRK2_STRCG|nr:MULTISPECIES: LrgB family protein [Streptococcus]EHI74724.1 LrgB family protein [Streptococcus criceti HS-6]SUN42906.1 murein hydrolase export regulator [Streptococcus criceti]
MADIYSNPIFGLSLSIFAYLIGLLIFRRFPHPATTPLLVATIALIVLLKITGISYADYYKGGIYLNTLIVPSTVALAIPLYRNFPLMKHHYRSILLGTSISTIINTCYTAVIAKCFGLDFFFAISLFPKSVTTAMAIGISQKMGGITTLTLAVVVMTGILTSVIGPSVLKFFKIQDPIAFGLALGGTGHAIGTGAALKYGQIQGAMAGLAIGVTGVMYVIISPIVAQLILR